MKGFLKNVPPWLITFTALYFAFRGLDWGTFFVHLTAGSSGSILGATAIMCLSYLVRAARWPLLLPHPQLTFLDSLKVLILGFFMNNVLPARAGEFVRAHVGSKVIQERRTRVLASIFGERLADGITISLLFGIFALKMGDSNLSNNFELVALGFGLVGIAVIFVIAFRKSVFSLVERLSEKFQGKASQFALKRAHIFVDGLSPLCDKGKIIQITCLSFFIWSIELFVYFIISLAYGAELTFAECVLFMVAVNFAGLIPAAPGGLGVIEAVGSAILISLGVPRELALTLVVTQHIMQYLVVGIPGAFILGTLRKYLASLQEPEELTA
jgi:uncharacterized protein (TIRG00374 family)